jgi:hypothetical protein
MARFVHVNFPVEQGGVARLPRAHGSFARVTALGALFFLLEAIGSIAFGAAERVGAGLAHWAEARRQREEDRKLWELALTDSRVMADLIALQQDAPRPGSSYF